MILPFLILLIPYLAPGAAANSRICCQAVLAALGELSFTGDVKTSYYKRVCTSPLRVYSYYAAISVYCPGSENLCYEYYNPYCQEYGDTEMIQASVYAHNLSSEYTSKLEVVSLNQIPDGVSLNSSVMISSSFYHLADQTEVVSYFQDWSNKTYGFAMYGFWGGILLVGIIHRLFSFIYARYVPHVYYDIEGQDNNHQPRTRKPIPLLSNAYHILRTHLIVPAAFKWIQKGSILMNRSPTRLEVLATAAFYILNIILCAVNIKSFQGNLYWSTIPSQNWKYLSNRTGVICVANMPLMWMFAGRNNMFIWATGWQFSTFNFFHRHIGRIVFIEALIHSIGYTVLYLEDGYYYSSYSEDWFTLGVVATVCMGVIIATAFVVVRRVAYDVFLLFHIALSIVTVVAMFYHLDIWGNEFTPYLWTIVAIWCLDRLLRFLRFILLNVNLGGKTVVQLPKARATYDKCSDIIRLEISVKSHFLVPGAGQYYYLRQPLALRGFQDHPFTLASWNLPSRETQESYREKSSGEKSIIPSVSSQPSSCEDSTRLGFLIKPLAGWTGRLRDQCLKSPDSSANMSMFFEGPYGERVPLSKYEHVVLFAGGSGITAVLPYILEHIQNQGTSTTVTRHITLVWSVRQIELIQQVTSYELRPIFGRNDIAASFYVTCTEESTLAKLDSVQDINILTGRPDTQSMVKDIAREISSPEYEGGRMAVLACGPTGLTSDVRRAIHESLQGGIRDIEYFEEKFGW